MKKKKAITVLLALCFLLVPTAVMYGMGWLFPYQEPESPADQLLNTLEPDVPSGGVPVEETGFRVAFKQPLPAPWMPLAEEQLALTEESLLGGTAEVKPPDFGYFYQDESSSTGGGLLLGYHTQPEESLAEQLFPAERTGTPEEFYEYFKENGNALADAIGSSRPEVARTYFPNVSVTPAWAAACGQPAYICESAGILSGGTNTGGAFVVLEKEKNLFFLVLLPDQPETIDFILDNVYFTE